MYDLYSNAVNIIFAVVFGLLGLFYLVAPYDTVMKFCPKTISKKVIRICGAALLILAVGGLVIDFM